jgi:hypothetical protein
MQIYLVQPAANVSNFMVSLHLRENIENSYKYFAPIELKVCAPFVC